MIWRIHLSQVIIILQSAICAQLLRMKPLEEKSFGQNPRRLNKLITANKCLELHTEWTVGKEFQADKGKELFKKQPGMIITYYYWSVVFP